MVTIEIDDTTYARLQFIARRQHVDVDAALESVVSTYATNLSSAIAARHEPPIIGGDE